MTGLYNALEHLRELENRCEVPPLTDSERDVHQAGLISALKEIHEQDQAEEELLGRLVALNVERAVDERRGVVRWLRPDFQIPKLAAKAPADRRACRNARCRTAGHLGAAPLAR